MQMDDYYGTEVEQVSFYKLPKFLMKEESLKGLSNDAKLLYAFMLDRMSLSRKNEWFDEENRVYIIYTLEHIMADLNCGRDKGMKVEAGIFGADMKIELLNDGPVTIMLDSEVIFNGK